TTAGVKFGYEARVVKFTIPAFNAKYHPDFDCQGGIIIEAKGRFGHRGNSGAEVRQRLALVREQHPDLDIRILFDKNAANLPIYKGSKTTKGQWATDHGFKWASGTVPAEWIAEMTSTNGAATNECDGNGASQHSERSTSHTASKEGARPPR